MQCPGDSEQLPTQRLADPVTRTLLQESNVFEQLAYVVEYKVNKVSRYLDPWLLRLRKTKIRFFETYSFHIFPIIIKDLIIR